MSLPTTEALLKARVHLGHPTSKWNPNMAPYIFMKRAGIHLIDINQTRKSLEKASQLIKQWISQDKKIMFVATKKQAKHIVATTAAQHSQPYMTERWFGGTLTNFANTIKKRIRKWHNIEKDKKSTTYQNLPKRERLSLQRESAKIHNTLKGVLDLVRLPDALFIIDPLTEHIAVQEAKKHGIPVIALTDTNTNPIGIKCVIPGNDDASTSIKLIMDIMGQAMKAGRAMRQQTGVPQTPNVPSQTTSDSNKANQKAAPVLEKKSLKKPTSSTLPATKPKTNATQAVSPKATTAIASPAKKPSKSVQKTSASDKSTAAPHKKAQPKASEAKTQTIQKESKLN